MALARRSLFRYLVLAAVVALWYTGHSLRNGGLSHHPSKETLRSLSLTRGQCKATFPGLTKEVDDAVARGPFILKKETADYAGLVQGRIKDGKIYIISADKEPLREMAYERNSILHQLHRAVVTSPEPISDTIFTFTISGQPLQNVWSFSRSNDPKTKDNNNWVMPYFSGWSWPKPFIATLDQALDEIREIEEVTEWENKIDKVVWRGTGQFNSVSNAALRPQLMEATRDKVWADVELLKGETNGVDAKNALGIADFCKYKYIVYTEGITYSGRLPFHQGCNSIILTQPPDYLLHTTHFMRPLFSTSLPFSYSAMSSVGPGVNQRWPESYPPNEANVVFVDYDWKDLEQTLFWLRAHPDIAKGIAQRQRELFVGKGYLSEAAGSCYWRALINGWSQVAKTDSNEWEEGGEISWETFSSTGKAEWD